MLSSCQTPRYSYSPAAHNVPLLVEKGDSKLGINYSTNFNGSKTINDVSYRGKSDGIDVHAAYAISNKFALQSSFFSRSEMNGGDDPGYADSSVIRYKRNLVEAGVGYFTKLGDNDYGNIYFQFFTGIGLGKFSFTDNYKDINGVPAEKFHQADIAKFYFQPALMFQWNKRLKIAVSSRFSVLDYHNVKTDYSIDQQERFFLREITGKPIVFWEPAFVNAIGLGSIPVRLEWQLGFSVLMSRRYIDTRSVNLSIGLQADIARLFKKKLIAARRD